MVAAPASQLKDHFSVLGVKRRFGLDKSELETRFYKLSRELHPDRFATGSMDERRQALEKMSLVNEAYRVLKDPDQLRDYFLKLVLGGGDSPKKGQIPVELAESWFELQEVLMENPAEGQLRVEEFKRELASLREKKMSDIRAFEIELNEKLDSLEASGILPSASYPKELFEKLAAMTRDLNYLESMERDVERIGGKRNVG